MERQLTTNSVNVLGVALSATNMKIAQDVNP